MAVSELFDISVSAESSAVTRAGFGVPLIAGASNAFPERYRVYEDLAGMQTDGLVAGTAEHAAAMRLLSSRVRPPKFVVGNLRHRPTQRWNVKPLTPIQPGIPITLTIKGKTATVTPGDTDTAADVVDALVAAIAALPDGGVPATVTEAGDGLSFTVTATTVGAFLPVKTGTRALLSVEQDHADAGIADDLSELLELAIASEGAADWYAICLCFPSTATIQAAAAWTEVNQRFLLAATNNTDVTTAATTDVASLLKLAAYGRTALIYHDDPETFLDAGWLGRCLPLTPGSETWQAKTIVGALPTSLTPTERANLAAKNVNYYGRRNGFNVTLGGAKVVGNEYIDTLRGIDELTARLGEDYTQLIADKDAKLPFDDGGISVVDSMIRNRLTLAIRSGLLKSDPAPEISVPNSSEVAPEDRAARILRATFAAELQGAIHNLTLRGVVTQ